jgi:hypothetical protein
MARSRKISLGFQVVNTRTGEAYSEVFARREPAREIARAMYARDPSVPIGIRHLEDYISEEEYQATRARKK